ncbi:hypothetical protein C8R46DRAFT_1354084 [Mycena filopes]|nr:hypothetical protein C8R46DRAFT_1354084 [Mycena filopes]
MSIAARCPSEMLLEFARHMDFRDLLNFLATCRRFRELRLERNIWLAALTHLRRVQMQPLPIAHLDDLDTLGRDELERIARRAGRLLRKFRAHQALDDPPQPVSIHRNFSVESYAKLICIEGTKLVLEHAFFDGIVRCWHVLTGELVAKLELRNFEIATSPCMDVRGKALIGGFLPGSWAVITVDYSDRSRIKMFHVVSPSLLPEFCTHIRLATGFFITPQLMGCTHDSNNIITWSMEAGDSVEFPVHQDDTITPPSALRGVCMAFGPNLYIFHPGFFHEHVAIRRLPLPSNPNGMATPAKPHTTILPVTHTFGAKRVLHRTIAASVATPPSYGVFAVTHKGFDHHKNLLHFWPLCATAPHVPAASLAFGAGYPYEHPQHFVQAAVGRSGTYVVVLVQVANERDSPGGISWRHRRDGIDNVGARWEGRLDLLHFSATPVPQVTCRRLDTGDLNPWGTHITLDESLGLVSLVGSEGKVTVISYL